MYYTFFFQISYSQTHPQSHFYRPGKQRRGYLPNQTRTSRTPTTLPSILLALPSLPSFPLLPSSIPSLWPFFVLKLKLASCHTLPNPTPGCMIVRARHDIMTIVPSRTMKDIWLLAKSPPKPSDSSATRNTERTKMPKVAMASAGRGYSQ